MNFQYKGHKVEIRTVIQVRIDGKIVDDQFITSGMARAEAEGIIDAQEENPLGITAHQLGHGHHWTEEGK